MLGFDDDTDGVAIDNANVRYGEVASDLGVYKRVFQVVMRTNEIFSTAKALVPSGQPSLLITFHARGNSK